MASAAEAYLKEIGILVTQFDIVIGMTVPDR